MELPKTPSLDLTGKRALVTGASSGIGLACATALVEAGASVSLAARSEDRLNKVVQEMQAKGWQAKALVLDIADVEATTACIEAEQPFDILVNSAGLARHSNALETRVEDFDAVMNINLRGAYFLTQLVAKGLIAAGKPGSLINISSQMAFVGGQERAVYCASKHAVEGFTKAMAIEWGKHRIRVNTLCSTFVLTPLSQPTFDDPEKRAWIESKIPLGRPAELEDMMGAVLFLASDASSMVTGSALKIDGGWTAG